MAYYNGYGRSAAGATGFSPQGFQRGAGALLAFNNGARAAALLARAIPFAGTAYGAATLVWWLWQQYSQRVTAHAGFNECVTCPSPGGTGEFAYYHQHFSCFAPQCNQSIVPNPAEFTIPPTAVGYSLLRRAGTSVFWWVQRIWFSETGTAQPVVLQDQPGRPAVYPVAVAVPVEGVWEEKKKPTITITFPWPRPVVRPGAGVGVVVRPGRRVVVEPVPVVRWPTTPAPGVQELKTRVFPVVAAILRGYNFATEMHDFVGALHRALPSCFRTVTDAMRRQRRAARENGWDRTYRAVRLSPAQQMLDVQRFLGFLVANPTIKVGEVCGGRQTGGVWTRDNRPGGLWGQLPQNNFAASWYVALAMHNVAWNEAQDHLFGRIGQELGRLSRGLNLPIGLQSMWRASRTGRIR